MCSTGGAGGQGEAGQRGAGSRQEHELKKCQESSTLNLDCDNMTSGRVACISTLFDMDPFRFNKIIFVVLEGHCDAMGTILKNDRIGIGS